MDSFVKDLLASNNLIRDPLGAIILTVIVIWSLAVKGVALWYSAQKNEKYWFIAILVLNTVGILEIAYLFIFSKHKLVISDVLARLKSLNIPKFSRK